MPPTQPIDEYRRFFVLSGEPLAIASLAGRFEEPNPAFARLFATTQVALHARSLVDLVHEDDRERAEGALEKLRSGVPCEGVVLRAKIQDNWEPIFWRATPDLVHECIYLTARLHASSANQPPEVHELEEQLVHANRMAAVGTLVAGVAHEIKNPLSYVGANIQFVMEELETLNARDPRLEEMLQVLSEAKFGAERIGRLVRDLHMVARQGERSNALLDLNEVLAVSRNMSANQVEHRARLVMETGTVPIVEGDDARLAQVFINLLVNAAHAVESSRREDRRVVIRTGATSEGDALVEISDTGCGMDQQVLQRIFEPYFTTKQKGAGTGLGLYIIRRIIEKHGGRIEVESVPGLGTTFRIILPAHGKRASESSAPRILLIERSKMELRALQRVLRGCVVTAEQDEARALERIQAGESFAAILCRLEMPSISGRAFYERVRAVGQEHANRIIFSVDGPASRSDDQFLRSIPNARIERPLQAHTLRTIVEAVINSQEADPFGTRDLTPDIEAEES